ncbi:lysylphosphatidylglycerol synthase transmembrane domain-containing protein [Cognatiyoonia sp. IB215182]|uniref:lysylphosphatidylglycerol synthase transmembrane domain-containing protein n=1 Tax=Cognatiyoonia sp. IB215182 TaxID=3097353 RepID=UPI002A1305B7|nr:lysylphosphatidylglycerol synthase transmembrane domain-containing protein [Cognatiyoonia sp. IB215182]MDX8352512.1 lysylphosphatidylglycerol synthase transmembrane domain-containing protein [Cognatiyoonia sp. IB215182]
MNMIAVPIPPIFWRIGQFALTGALIVLLWTAADGAAIARTLGSAHPGWVAAAVITLVFQTILSAWRWKVTAGALGQTLPLSKAVHEYFLSQAVNQSLPGGCVGDAARAVRARADVGLAVSGLAVGLERLAGQIIMFTGLACAFVITYFTAGGLDWPPSYAGPIGLTIGLIALGFIGLAALRGPIRALKPSVAHWIDMGLRALASRDVLPAQVTLGIMIATCNLAAFGFCAWAVGQHLQLGVLLAVVPLILFTMLIPLTVSGWGARETGAAALLPIAGVPVAESVAASILFGLALLVAVTPGFLAMIAKR